MKVRVAQDKDYIKWDDFCKRNQLPYAHYSNWFGIHRELGYEMLPLIAFDKSNEIIGIHNFSISNKFFDKFRASTPPALAAASYGGPFVEDSNAILPLIEAADDHFSNLSLSISSIGIDVSIKHFEIVKQSYLDSGYINLSRNTKNEDLWSNFRLDLVDFEANWAAFSRSAKRYYKRAINKNLVIEEVGIDDFCQLFPNMMIQVYKRLNNWCPQTDRLKKILTSKDVNPKLYLASINKNCVGGMSCYYSGNGCFSILIASDGDYDYFHVNNALCINAIREACNAGLQFFDMGLTAPPNKSGHYKWKSKYKGTSSPVIRLEKKINRAKVALNNYVNRVSNKFFRGYSYGNSPFNSIVRDLDKYRRL